VPEMASGNVVLVAKSRAVVVFHFLASRSIKMAQYDF
jgi:hypothetical protein